jgi:hypothetical protein
MVGKRVAAIRRMTEQETASRGWNCGILPTVLVLDDGSIVMAKLSDGTWRDLSATPDSDETQKWEGSETQTECSLVPSVSTSKANSGDSGADSDASEDLFQSGPQQDDEGGPHDPHMRMLQEDAGTEQPDGDTEEPGSMQLAVEKADDVQTESSSTEDEAPEQDTEQEQEQKHEKEGATEGARPSKSLPTDRLLSNATAAVSPTCRLSGTDPYAEQSGGDSKSEGMGGDRSSHHEQREDATLTLPTHTQELVFSPSNAANKVEEQVDATQRWDCTEGGTQEYEELAASSSKAANEVKVKSTGLTQTLGQL